MVFCTLDSVELGRSNKDDFKLDSSLGWLHRHGDSWYTVMGTPVVETDEGGVRRTVVKKPTDAVVVAPAIFVEDQGG